MNYTKIYEKLIEFRKDRILDDNEYYENHHIVPKSLEGRLFSEEHIEAIRNGNLGRKYSDDQRISRYGKNGEKHPTAKHWKVMSPKGEVFEFVGGIKKFCIDHDIKYRKLIKHESEWRVLCGHINGIIL